MLQKKEIFTTSLRNPGGRLEGVHLGTFMQHDPSMMSRCTPSRRSKNPSPCISKIMKEYEITKELQHPNIIKMYNCYEMPEKLYFVMELATGGDLFTRINEQGPFGEEQCRIIMSQLLRALEYMHSKHHLHRDLKLDNIMLLDKQALTIKLVDFGIARVMSDDDKPTTFVGTDKYLAPEIIDVLQGKRDCYNTQADVWAAGVVFYMLICGDYPFTDPGIAKKIQTGKYSLVKKEWKSVSTSCKDLLPQMLNPDPSQRITAAQALQHPWLTGTDTK